MREDEEKKKIEMARREERRKKQRKWLEHSLFINIMIADIYTNKFT